MGVIIWGLLCNNHGLINNLIDQSINNYITQKHSCYKAMRIMMVTDTLAPNWRQANSNNHDEFIAWLQCKWKFSSYNL